MQLHSTAMVKSWLHSQSHQLRLIACVYLSIFSQSSFMAGYVDDWRQSTHTSYPSQKH